MDKGTGVVIMDKQDYYKKLDNILNDKKHQKKWLKNTNQKMDRQKNTKSKKHQKWLKNTKIGVF